MRKLGRTSRSGALFLLLLSILINTAGGIQASGETAVNRNEDPVVLRGSVLSSTLNMPVGKIFAYAYDGAVWRQIPAQVDEVNATGNYVAAEDGLFDANDELVFMAKDLGVKAVDPPSGGGQPLVPAWYEVQVTDPLVPGASGWVYVVASSALTSVFPEDYVSFDPALHRITGENYKLGFATPKLWVDYLTLSDGSVDIIDRTPKLRACRSFICVNENSLPDVQDDLVKDGRVRLIFRQGKVLAYASLATVEGSFNIPSSLAPDSLRFSTDFNASASNSTFYNAAVPGGVVVNGVPDNVPANPLSTWSQLSRATGTVVQVSDVGQVGGVQTNYYVDDQQIDNTDTGDQRRYGDNGIRVNNPNLSFSLKFAFFFLNSSQPNIGASYVSCLQQSLIATPRLQVLQQSRQVYLPMLAVR